MSDDAAIVAPHVYKVVFENDKVRVLEVSMAPGASTSMHTHPDYVAYLQNEGKVRFTMPDGETAEVEFPAGTVMWREAEEHATENIGSSELRAIFFEPK
jgi:beta-alanine degradation protein BauB